MSTSLALVYRVPHIRIRAAGSQLSGSVALCFFCIVVQALTLSAAGDYLDCDSMNTPTSVGLQIVAFSSAARVRRPYPKKHEDYVAPGSLTCLVSCSCLR